MGDTSARLAVGFSWAGHTIMHLVAALYLTVVLALEREWGLSYDELIRLWTLGALLIGVGAPIAGWLGDRWSENGMMAVFYLLTGGGAIACGLARDTTELWIALAVLGLGASIYHPVSMSVIVKNATNRGKAMGWLGIFGTIGIACAGIVAGALSDLAGWRAAFLIPGAVCTAFGVALTACLLLGLVRDREGDRRPQAAVSRGDVYRAFVVLSVTMLCAGVMFNAMQVVLPKLFEDRLAGLVGEGTLGIGGLVTLVYLVAAVPQLIGGHMADRYPLKRIYLLCLFAQVPLMALLAFLSGVPVVAAAAAVVISSQVQIPAENLLLARYTPARHRGLAFGAKFVLSFGAGPVAVQMAAYYYERFSGFEALYLTLAALGVAAALAAILLPSEEAKAPAPAVGAPQAALGGE